MFKVGDWVRTGYTTGRVVAKIIRFRTDRINVAVLKTYPASIEIERMTDEIEKCPGRKVPKTA